MFCTCVLIVQIQIDNPSVQGNLDFSSLYLIIMADSDTSELYSTASDSDNQTPSVVNFYIIAHSIQFAITLMTFTYGVTSWCLIRKFRNFNNYVYVNIILVNIIRLTLVSITKLHTDEGAKSLLNFVIFMFLSTVFNYWLLIICYMFYVDVVKVFSGDIKQKFLKSFVLAWGLPLTGLIFGTLMLKVINTAIEDEGGKFFLFFSFYATLFSCDFVPLIINIVLFVKLVHSLFFCQEKNTRVVPENQREKENWRRLLTATAMFMLTNINVLIMIIWVLFLTKFSLRAVTFCIQTIILALFIPLVKSNRKLWYEYFVNRKNRTMS